jgi:hypothetical protein
MINNTKYFKITLLLLFFNLFSYSQDNLDTIKILPVSVDIQSIIRLSLNDSLLEIQCTQPSICEIGQDIQKLSTGKTIINLVGIKEEEITVSNE